jgi:uncharacterized protein YecE (DUF72 family)
MSHTTKNILIGCAGWSLSAKHTAGFPGTGTHLQRYARVFPAVEINSSFYRAHQASTYARWRDSVPDTFRFSVKLSKIVTHTHRLEDCQEPIAVFMEQVSELRQKLGCLLVQLPPSLEYSISVADLFFDNLRQRYEGHIACEPRHASWFTPAAAKLLRNYQIGGVQADPSPVPGKKLHGYSKLIYLRMHGCPKIYYSAYSSSALAALASNVEKSIAQGKTVWCIFDNTANGEAIPNALELSQRFDSERRDVENEGV